LSKKTYPFQGRKEKWRNHGQRKDQKKRGIDLRTQSGHNERIWRESAIGPVTNIVREGGNQANGVTKKASDASRKYESVQCEDLTDEKTRQCKKHQKKRGPPIGGTK